MKVIRNTVLVISFTAAIVFCLFNINSFRRTPYLGEAIQSSRSERTSQSEDFEKRISHSGEAKTIQRLISRTNVDDKERELLKLLEVIAENKALTSFQIIEFYSISEELRRRNIVKRMINLWDGISVRVLWPLIVSCCDRQDKSFSLIMGNYALGKSGRKEGWKAPYELWSSLSEDDRLKYRGGIAGVISDEIIRGRLQIDDWIHTELSDQILEIMCYSTLGTASLSKFEDVSSIILSIEDDHIRSKAVRSFVGDWAHEDPEACRAWIANANEDSIDTKGLLEYLERIENN